MILNRNNTGSFVLAFCLVLAGCTSDSSTVSQQVDQVDESTARLLVGSQQALYRGQLTRAQILADSAVARLPRLADAHFQRARVLSVMNQYDDAEHAYLQAVTLDTSYSEAWINLGHNASRQLQYRKALQYYHKAAKLKPASAGVYLGRTYAALGKADSSQRAYEQVLATDSSSAPAHLWLSVLYKDQGNLSGALQHARRAAALQPENIDYQYVLGSHLLAAGDLDGAREYLEAVARQQPWHYGAHYRLGRIMAQRGEVDEAEAQIALADSLQQLQSEAVRLEEVIRMRPEDPRPWIQKGQTLERLGRHQEAAAAFRIAQTLVESSTP